MNVSAWPNPVVASAFRAARRARRGCRRTDYQLIGLRRAVAARSATAAGRCDPSLAPARCAAAHGRSGPISDHMRTTSVDRQTKSLDTVVRRSGSRAFGPAARPGRGPSGLPAAALVASSRSSNRIGAIAPSNLQQVILPWVRGKRLAHVHQLFDDVARLPRTSRRAPAGSHPRPQTGLSQRTDTVTNESAMGMGHEVLQRLSERRYRVVCCSVVSGGPIGLSTRRFVGAAGSVGSHRL